MKSNYVELWDKPEQELRSKVFFKSEMSSYDHAFICGLIKQNKPQKLLEIGVAEGGTTAIIINCLALLKLNCEIYSIDLCERLYHDITKRTGYEYNRLSIYIKKESEIKHQIRLGKTIGGQIEEIGNGIDFVILDTTHSLPGEILDFLCILPYLAKGAILVLHDTNLNCIRALGDKRKQVIVSPEYIATKLLLATVVADKYLPTVQDGLANIAAFKISEDTYKYIGGLFYLLTCTWKRVPKAEILQEYRNIYEKHYEDWCLRLFDIAVMNNRRMLGRIEVAQNVQSESIIKYRFPYSEIPIGSNVVLYGAGKAGKEVFEAQKERNIYNIVLWVDQKYEQYTKEGLDVRNPDETRKTSFDYIVVAVEAEELFQEIRSDIIAKGYNAGKPILGPISKY